MGEASKEQIPFSLIEFLSVLARPEDLVTLRGGIFLSIALSIVMFVTLNWGGADKRFQIIGAVLVFVAALTGWRICRGLYWRYGNGRRIGLAYLGHRVARHDWDELRRQLNDLFAEAPASRRILIRHIPHSLTKSEVSWKAVQEKYKFDAVLKVVVSPSTDPKGDPVFEAELQPQFRSAMSLEILKQANAIGTQLFRDQKINGSVHKQIQLRANSFFHTIILFAALQDFSEQRFDDASRYLSHLDNRIASSFAVTNPLRHYIRFLDSLCLVQTNIFSPDDPPVEAALLQAKDSILLAIDRYPAEFPALYHTAARTLFYCGDIDAAFDLTVRALNMKMPPQWQVYSLLNFAVLSLFRSNWVMASEKLREAILSDHFESIDFRPLILFADFARDSLYESAVYLQVLYRVLCSEPVPPPIKVEFDKWIGEERSKDDLIVITNELARIGLGKLKKRLSTTKSISQKLTPKKRKKK